MVPFWGGVILLKSHTNCRTPFQWFVFYFIVSQMIPFFTGVRWAAQWGKHYEGKHTVCWKESRRDGAKNREPREAQPMWSATTSHGQALPSCQTPNSSSPSCFTFLWKPNVQLERCSVEQKGSQFNTFVKMLPCKSTVRIPMSQEER